MKHISLIILTVFFANYSQALSEKTADLFLSTMQCKSLITSIYAPPDMKNAVSHLTTPNELAYCKWLKGKSELKCKWENNVNKKNVQVKTYKVKLKNSKTIIASTLDGSSKVMIDLKTNYMNTSDVMFSSDSVIKLCTGAHATKKRMDELIKKNKKNK